MPWGWSLITIILANRLGEGRKSKVGLDRTFKNFMKKTDFKIWDYSTLSAVSPTWLSFYLAQLLGGVDDLFLFLKNHGVTPLHNSHVKISGDNSEDFLYLVGTDDIEADKFRWEKQKLFLAFTHLQLQLKKSTLPYPLISLCDVHPPPRPHSRYKGHGFKLDSAVNATDEDHIRILLAHQPKAASKALNSPFHFDLILSGHTHGGQFFPYNGLIWLGNPFFRGLYEGQGPNGNSQVYVTEGSVFWGSPFRFGSTMEITKIVLQKWLSV